MTKHFDKQELIRCYRDEGRCKECKLAQAAMRLPYGIEDNVMALVEDVLEPVRVRFGKPIVVNSGFRCPLHNRTVGGGTVSQHMKGEAVDITAGSPAKNLELARMIVENGEWDQMILYPMLTSSTSDATRESSNKLGSPSLLARFVHVSYKRGDVNRREILRKTSGGYVKLSINDLK